MDELAESWAQDYRENQHIDDIKRQQDLKAKAEMAQAVMKKAIVTRASQLQPAWYPNDAQFQEIPSQGRLP